MKLKQIKQIEQLSIVKELAHLIWHEHYIPIIGEKQVEYMLEKMYSKTQLEDDFHNGVRFDLIKLDDNFVGYSAYEIKDNKVILHKLYLTKNCRGKGLGKLLVNEIVKFALEHHILVVELNVNKNNLHSIMAYERLGFKCVREVKIDIGEGFFMDDFVLEKRVS